MPSESGSDIDVIVLAIKSNDKTTELCFLQSYDVRITKLSKMSRTTRFGKCSASADVIGAMQQQEEDRGITR